MPNSEAEALQIKAIIQQSFDVWEANRADQIKREAKPGLGSIAPAWIACALSIIGFVLVAGGVNEKVNRNGEEIAALKQSDREQNDKSTEVLQRLTTIETLIRSDDVGR